MRDEPGRRARPGNRVEPAADVPGARPAGTSTAPVRRTPRCSCVLLDEYVGLPAGHPQSYRATIARELTDALGIPAERVHGPDPGDPEHAGPAYEALLDDLGGVDLQVLGIGTDGHLAFNEPGSSLGPAPG